MRLRRRKAHDAILGTLNGVVSQTADAEEYLVLDQKGIVRLSTTQEHEGASDAHEPYFVQASSAITVVQPIYDSRLTGQPTITIARRCSTRTARRSASSRPI